MTLTLAEPLRVINVKLKSTLGMADWSSSPTLPALIFEFLDWPLRVGYLV
jgi:hypothetical protein